MTGRRFGPPLLPPGCAASASRGAGIAIEALSTLLGSTVAVDAVALLGERAALLGLGRRGRRSPGGSCRIIQARDGWVAVNLPRPYDHDVLPALIEAPVTGGNWEALARWARSVSADHVVDRAALLDVAASRLPVGDGGGRRAPSRAPITLASPRRAGVPGFGRCASARAGAPLVVDLSSLWAGPLCANLLGLAGATVVKVESLRRPDGARLGSPAFYDLLHAGHASVALDFATPAGRRALAALIETADVVIESSRPRALEQLGFDAAEQVASRATTWVSITAYGRSGPLANRVGFGDDVAWAAGLAARERDGGAPLPCGDALADPLAGVHAAAAAMAGLLGGGGWLIDVSMRDVLAATIGCRATPAVREPRPRRIAGRWSLDTEAGPIDVEAPRARTPHGRAARLGKHTRQMLAELVGERAARAACGV